ncbi:MAG: hypothetical protein K5774_06740 [Clostridia bacterium]|nr:hypothetical protein [Clostridia bacterium]
MRKLTEEEVLELRTYKTKENGDELYWDRLAEIYADDIEALDKIHFEKRYLYSVKCIPLAYQSYGKTLEAYLETVDEFNKEIGYTDEAPDPDKPDEFLGTIAERFGLDFDLGSGTFTPREMLGLREKEKEGDASTFTPGEMFERKE